MSVDSLLLSLWNRLSRSERCYRYYELFMDTKIVMIILIVRQMLLKCVLKRIHFFSSIQQIHFMSCVALNRLFFIDQSHFFLTRKNIFEESQFFIDNKKHWFFSGQYRIYSWRQRQIAYFEMNATINCSSHSLIHMVTELRALDCRKTIKFSTKKNHIFSFKNQETLI